MYARAIDESLKSLLFCRPVCIQFDLTGNWA